MCGLRNGFVYTYLLYRLVQQHISPTQFVFYVGLINGREANLGEALHAILSVYNYHFDVKIGTAVRNCQEEKAKHSKRLGYYYEYFDVLRKAERPAYLSSGTDGVGEDKCVDGQA